MVWCGMVWCYGMVWYGINNMHLGKLLVRLVKAVHLCLKFMHLLETMGRLGGGAESQHCKQKLFTLKLVLKVVNKTSSPVSYEAPLFQETVSSHVTAGTFYFIYFLRVT